MKKLDKLIPSHDSNSFLFDEKLDQTILQDEFLLQDLDEPEVILKQDHEPSWNDYFVEEILGQGSYGRIYKVRE